MMKVGILFGGPSREREIAFAGGRTVYDNLDKSIFEPVPIFIDSLRHFIQLDWQYIYKGSIRDFYPPVDALPLSSHAFQIYVESLGKLSEEEFNTVIQKVGKKINPIDLPKLMDVAFLALHGNYGEDGQIQGLLDSLQVPYTGSGVRACTIGMDKAFQKKLMEAGGFATPNVMVLDRQQWINGSVSSIFETAKSSIGFPMVVRPANQGSSIGVAIIKETATPIDFEHFVNRAFFRERLTNLQWKIWSEEERVQYVRELTDIRDGLGFPMNIQDKTVYHPETLWQHLNTLFEGGLPEVFLESHLSEQRVIIESFIHGKEFSCIVIRNDDGKAVALPPTEIIKGSEVFDYRSKYLPGLSRKETPINLPEAQIHAIRQACERLFSYLEFNTYARIDGFITSEETIFLNDPNTTSGMLPSSFFFHQAAEIGLNPSQFLTYIIRTSLEERILTTNEINHYQHLLNELDEAIHQSKSERRQKKKIAVILGGYSAERHISVESGRNIFEKLSSSDKYEPIPVFLTGSADAHEFYQIPINLLLKDNADDIRDKIKHFEKHPVIEAIKFQCKGITQKYAARDVVFEPKLITYNTLGSLADAVFIALHGRPGEDGQVQERLDALQIPYNGSGVNSSRTTIDKYKTLQILKQHGFPVTEQMLIYQEVYEANNQATLSQIEAQFTYPFIAKPVDDGCSAAVKVIKTQTQLQAFLNQMFRKEESLLEAEREILHLKPKEEFPRKNVVLIEGLITSNGAKHFLEITGGLLTHRVGDEIQYELFEPSETLASGEVLSLEEKFLAGEGQNITPARYSKKPQDYPIIAAQVKATLEAAAKILEVEGYARIDAFVRIYEDNRAETVIIEVNSLPGMTPATCIYHQAALNGYKPYDFIDRIIDFGMNNTSK